GSHGCKGEGTGRDGKTQPHRPPPGRIQSRKTGTKGKPMKALSLWQPYASLIAVGAKRYETRHWKTDYRGPIAIHAAKRRITNDEWLYIRFDPNFRAISRTLGFDRGIDPNTLPYGAVVCVAELVNCIPTESLEDGDAYLRGGTEYLLA